MKPIVVTPKVLHAAGNKPKLIEEYVGRLATGAEAASVARMVSPGGWAEPAQTPEFDEFSVVLRGSSTRPSTTKRWLRALDRPFSFPGEFA